MPFNGSGTYNLYTPGNPVVTGTTISSTWANNTLSDLATGLSTAITKDGQTNPTANLPMAGFRHTGVGAATARDQYARVAEVQDGTFLALTSTAGTDTITATAALSMAAYASGQMFSFVPANTNTGAATININALGAKSITKNGTTALAAGDLVQNAVALIRYDGTQFQLLNPTGVTIPSLTANAQTGTYTLLPADKGKVVTCSGTFQVDITAAATLGSGWWCWLINIGTGTITLDANSTEVIQYPGGSNAGDTTMTLPYSGTTTGPYNVSGILLWCNGTGFNVLATRETHGQQLFTGNGTWTAPAGVTKAWITGCGGGGQGGGGTSGSALGGGGGGAAAGIDEVVTVVPATAYSVTIGAGGSTGGSGASGQAGGTTSIGALKSYAGGAGGTNAGSGGASGGVGGTTGGNGVGGTALGGAGGGSIFGAGGFGSTTVGVNGGGFGAGGGGGGSSSTNTGATGSAGFILVRW